MAMTAGVKDELSRLPVTKPCCRRAEMAALLRFAGGLHLVSGRVVVEAELDTGSAARRLRREVAQVFGHSSDVHVLAAAGRRRRARGRRWNARRPVRPRAATGGPPNRCPTPPRPPRGRTPGAGHRRTAATPPSRPAGSTAWSPADG